MRVMIACEFSGTVREAFRVRGHDAISCDLLPSRQPGPHIQGDIRAVDLRGYDLLIAHPPCTYLCASGLHWNHRRPGRAALTEDALHLVRYLLNAPVPAIALENPRGCISTRIRHYDQEIQPYDFGHDASKATCLWLKSLPPLHPTCRIAARIVDGRRRWANQTDSGQNRLTPSPERAQLRSITYQGIAAAMADQWGTATERHDIPVALSLFDYAT